MVASIDVTITSIAGIVGVLLGVVLAPWFTRWFTARDEARLAALLASQGLEDWRTAIAAVRQHAEQAGRAEDPEITLALALGAASAGIDLRWWDDTRTQLMRGATEEEIGALRKTSRGCWYVLEALSEAREAGRLGVRNLIAAREARGRADAAQAKLDATDDDGGRAPRDPRQGETDAEHHDETMRIADQAHASVDSMNATLEALGADPVMKDHRLWLMDGYWRTFDSMTQPIEEAIEICDAIRTRNGRFWRGLLSTSARSPGR